MLGLVGIKKNVDIDIREKMSISQKKLNVVLYDMKQVFEEIVILSTCNRTEIYFNSSLEREETLKKIFEILNWDNDLKEHVFYLSDEDVVKHLFEVICGFHSRILGEDQILGQIRDSYELSLNKSVISTKLQRLFQDAIACGKRFRNTSRLYEIPVSSSSIAVNKVLELGAKRLMVIGYGTIGSLVVKYALGSELDEINIVVRDKTKVDEIDDSRVNILNYAEAKEVINFMDAVISCTSAPHTIVKKEDINVLGKNIALIDLALPRDIEVSLKEYKRVLLYDIDDISRLDHDNKMLRIERMNSNKYILEEYYNNYIEWLQLRNITNYIKVFKDEGKKVVDDRIKSFQNKCSEEEDISLATTLIKSTSDYYINRAIKVLKEEKLKGRESECLKILAGIFMEN